jgi:protein SCO1/2
MEGVRGCRWAAWAAIVAALLPVAVRAADPPVTWTLQAVDHRVVTVTDLPATWLLVYFGYTYCPDLCPTALLEIGDVLRDLGGMAGRVQPVFVTIDPERDTPELLARYVANFAAPIIPLTGTPEQIGGAARQLGYHYVRYRDPGLGGYSFDHTSSFFLVDPGRHLVADFATELTATEIAAGIRDRMATDNDATRAEAGRP